MMKDIKNYTNNNKMFGISQAMDIEQFHNEMLQNDWFCSLGQNHSKTDVIAYGDDYENTVYAVFINGRLDHITLE